jgi:hypothetical protein
MKRRQLQHRTYDTPEGFKCPECGELCTIIFRDNSFDYAGTHCNYGMSGTHYPSDYGEPVTDCCEVFVTKEDLNEQL